MFLIKKGKAFKVLESRVKDLMASGETHISLTDLQNIMSKASAEQFNKRFDGEEVAQELSDFVNSMHQPQEEDFVNTVLSNHRTLQTDTFNLFYTCLEGWASNADSGNYDSRNENACKTSKMMVDATN